MSKIQINGIGLDNKEEIKKATSRKVVLAIKKDIPINYRREIGISSIEIFECDNTGFLLYVGSKDVRAYNLSGR